jgi:hypothetical protein
LLNYECRLLDYDLNKWGILFYLIVLLYSPYHTGNTIKPRGKFHDIFASYVILKFVIMQSFEPFRRVSSDMFMPCRMLIHIV